jgi:hypothetical protein
MLESMQRHFFETLKQERPAPLLGASNIGPEQTWAIYRRNYLEGHVAALADTYGTVRDLVGIDYFGQLARRYVSKYDSLSGDLNDYGNDFADFLDAFLTTAPGGAALPYLPDIARLDWLWFAQLRAPLAAADWLDKLLALPPACWQDITAFPAGLLLRSEFPIYRIWRLNQGDVGEVDLSADGETVFLTRPDSVAVTLLSEAQAIFIEHWFSGETLGFALTAALEIDDDFDFPAFLLRLRRLAPYRQSRSTQHDD